MNQQNTRSCYFKCADINFEITSPYPIGENTFHPKLMEFQVPLLPSDTSSAPDNITIQHHFSIPERFTSLSNAKAVSEQTLWTVFRQNDNWIYRKFPALPVAPAHEIFMESSPDFSRHHIYCDCITEQDYENGSYASMTIFGCDQIIMSKLLSVRQGLLLHANGFVANNKGFLLTGPSTAGKTTLSGMLRENGFKIFSDDRAIVRLEHGKWYMEGSWFHGSTPVTSTERFELGGIFFLEHAKENIISPMDFSQKKLGSILQALVRPHITPKEWEAVLVTVETLGRNIPCHKLRFDLSGDIVSRISHLINQTKPQEK